MDEHRLLVRVLSCKPVSLPYLTHLTSHADVIDKRVVIWTLNKGGTKTSIVTTAVLILLGNWIRYAGTRANGGIFGVAMLGQILIGFAQPFCLCAPTRFSDQWFSDRGRTSATALASLANPLGGALGQLIGPIMATKASEIPNLVLYISIIVSIGSFLYPFAPISRA